MAGFLPDCVEFDPKARIKVADFCLAFSAWFVEQKGEDRRPPSNDSIRKALKAVGDGRIVTERTKTSRYYCGVALNKLGLRYHQSAYESHIFEGKTALTKAPGSDVNSLIPAAWDERESIIAMRAYHQRVTDATSGVTDQRNERRDLAEIVGEDDDDE
ncbi:hypothetical protein [Bradyrhizobium mercantei]|uniref:hypothetical protein n=1 Tax=Bradyrhizobium mercantei TaxID=1904807 RepID=UPI0009787363|nr:hypothetical protein [Bradyrhizobium mercantei]